MKSELPKVLHEVGGRAMLDWAIAAAAQTGAERTVVVTGAHAPAVGEHVAKRLGPNATAIQDPPLGTAHAVRAAEAALAGFDGDVIILYGDAPVRAARAHRGNVRAARREGRPRRARLRSARSLPVMAV